MSRNKITGVVILLFLLSVIFLQATYPKIFNILSKQVPVKIKHQTTDKSNTQNDSSSSLHNSSLPVPTFEIVIDPGHGGIDTGVDKGSVIESEVTLDVSQKMKAYLEEKSHSVELTRSSDISLYPLSNMSGTQQRRELDARVNIINKSQAKIFVSIHVNSYPEYPDMSGSIVYYNTLTPQSWELSDCIQKQLNGISAANFIREPHDPQEADFYLLKNSGIPGVLVETAFITNSKERKLLSQDNFRSQIAKAVADGIESYLAEISPPS
jgi:N-acetylmuramoyl-L-alanine amidase